MYLVIYSNYTFTFFQMLSIWVWQYAPWMVRRWKFRFRSIERRKREKIGLASKAKIKDGTSTFTAVTSRFLSCYMQGRSNVVHARTVLYVARPSIKMSRRADSPEGAFANAIKRERARVANNYWTRLNLPLWSCQIANRYNDRLETKSIVFVNLDPISHRQL